MSQITTARRFEHRFAILSFFTVLHQLIAGWNWTDFMGQSLFVMLIVLMSFVVESLRDPKRRAAFKSALSKISEQLGAVFVLALVMQLDAGWNWIGFADRFVCMAIVGIVLHNVEMPVRWG